MSSFPTRPNALAVLALFHLALCAPKVWAEDPESITEAKQWAQEFEQQIARGRDAAMLSAEKRAFLTGVLIPLFGPGLIYASRDGQRVRRPWKVYESGVSIRFGTGDAWVVWSGRVQDPQFSDGRLVIPTEWRWTPENIERVGIPLFRQWAPHTARVTQEYFLSRLSEPNLFQHLPLYSARREGVQTRAEIEERAASIPADLKGAVEFDDLIEGGWYLHPVEGFVQLGSRSDENGGTVGIRFGRQPKGMDTRTVRVLKNERATVWARRDSPAWDALRRARAIALFPIENVALVFAYNHLFWRYRHLKQNVYSQIYDELPGPKLYATLEDLLCRLKDQLVFRGIGYEEDLGEVRALVKRFADQIYAELHEDIVKTGLLMTPRDPETKQWRLQITIGDRTRIIKEKLPLQRQLDSMRWDVNEYYRTFSWQYGRNALVAQKEVVDAEKLWVHDLGTYFSENDPEHAEDRYTQSVRLVRDYGSLAKARTMVHEQREELAKLKMDEFDLVIPMPGMEGQVSGSNLFAEALVREFGLYWQRMKDLLHRTEQRDIRSLPLLSKTLVGQLHNTGMQFAITSHHATKVRGRRVLLVGDVSSTYIDAHEAARVLRDCGARDVVLVSMGHAAPGPVLTPEGELKLDGDAVIRAEVAAQNPMPSAVQELAGPYQISALVEHHAEAPGEFWEGDGKGSLERRIWEGLLPSAGSSAVSDPKTRVDGLVADEWRRSERLRLTWLGENAAAHSYGRFSSPKKVSAVSRETLKELPKHTRAYYLRALVAQVQMCSNPLVVQAVVDELSAASTLLKSVELTRAELDMWLARLQRRLQSLKPSPSKEGEDAAAVYPVEQEVEAVLSLDPPASEDVTRRLAQGKAPFFRRLMQESSGRANLAQKAVLLRVGAGLGSWFGLTFPQQIRWMEAMTGPGDEPIFVQWLLQRAEETLKPSVPNTGAVHFIHALGELGPLDAEAARRIQQMRDRASSAKFRDECAKRLKENRANHRESTDGSLPPDAVSTN